MSYLVSFIPKKKRPTRFLKTLKGGLLDVMAALAALQERPARDCEFRARVLAAASSLLENSGTRTICAPDEKLKTEQRCLLRELERIPAHPSAHGFVRDRSAHTCAQAHAVYWGKDANHLVILNGDAKNFFHSCGSDEVRKALAAHGLEPQRVRQVIDACMATPGSLMADAVLVGLWKFMRREMQVDSEKDGTVFECARASLRKGRRQDSFLICQAFLGLGPGINLGTRFLPQGAPTSPHLSNLMMKLADIRISALAGSFGAFYTRYADDLTFSWIAPAKGKTIDGLYRCAADVLSDYDLQFNRRKKRVMGMGVRQDVVGYCLNSGRPTITQQYRKKLRAALHNEVVRGSNRYRTGGRSSHPNENYKSEHPSVSRVGELAGKIGHIRSCHPEEASRRLELLKHVRDRVDRVPILINEHNGIQIEPATELEQLLS